MPRASSRAGGSVSIEASRHLAIHRVEARSLAL
jgi:hypothetical protein